MLKLVFLSFTFFPQDTTLQDTTRSIMFRKQLSPVALERMKYQHQQGFFCDFEDRISKDKKMKLNLGVGDQK